MTDTKPPPNELKTPPLVEAIHDSAEYDLVHDFMIDSKSVNADAHVHITLTVKEAVHVLNTADQITQANESNWIPEADGHPKPTASQAVWLHLINGQVIGAYASDFEGDDDWGCPHWYMSEDGKHVEEHQVRHWMPRTPPKPPA